ncbi:hypothetical protein BZA05DRAFT_474135, partial [Tricharina praecox]|uniref:uncharacterized protein n=1 Tax=Tricharina praecox TaxID=43433 RepID=UPI00221F08CB
AANHQHRLRRRCDRGGYHPRELRRWLPHVRHLLDSHWILGTAGSSFTFVFPSRQSIDLHRQLFFSGIQRLSWGSGG